MNRSQIHAGIRVCQTDILSVLPEAVCSVLICHYCPDICVCVAGDCSVLTYCDICTHIIESSFFRGQRLIIGRRVNHDLIAVCDRGFRLLRSFCLSYCVCNFLHRTNTVIMNRHCLQRAVCCDDRLIFFTVKLAGFIFGIRRITSIQCKVNLRFRSRGTQRNRCSGCHLSRLRICCRSRNGRLPSGL